MQKGHGELGYGAAAVTDAQPAIAAEMAEVAHFDIPEFGQFLQTGELFFRHGQNHALLCFRKPDLPWGQAGILEGNVLQLNVGAQLFAHFADGGGKTAGAAVGDGVVEAGVPGCFDQLDEALFGDGIADLHGAAGLHVGCLVQLGGGEGGAVDAVATGASAEDNDTVARLWFCWMCTLGKQSDCAAENEGIAEIAAVVDDRPVDGRQAEFIAVVADSGNDSLFNAGGVENAGGEFVRRQVLGAEAEDVGTGNWPGGNGDDVTDDAADAGIGAAEGFECRRVIVCLYFEGQIEVIVEVDDAGVVDKGGAHPGAIHLLGGGLDVGAKQTLDLLRG